MSIRPRNAKSAIPASRVVEADKATEVLNDVEKAAACLEAQSEWQPMQALNSSHLVQLKKAQALAPDLARRIDAYAHCAAMDKMGETVKA